jgi:hypothetical protein
MTKVSEKLEGVLKDLEAANQLANMDLMQHDWRTRSGMENLKYKSKERVLDLTMEYHKAFSEVVSKVFLNCSTEQVAKLGEELERYGLGAFHSVSLYHNLAEVVKPMLSLGSIFSTAAYVRLVELLGDLGRSHGIVPYNNPTEPVNVVCNTFDDLVNLVRNVVRASFGDQLNRAYILNTVAGSAIGRKFNGDKAVVLLNNMTPEEIGTFSEGLYPGQPTFNLEIDQGEEINYKSLVGKINTRVSQAFYKKSEAASKQTQAETN